jgi:hypothetical protein
MIDENNPLPVSIPQEAFKSHPKSVNFAVVVVTHMFSVIHLEVGAFSDELLQIFYTSN